MRFLAISNQFLAKMPTIPMITLGSGHEMPTFGLGTWLSEKGKVEMAVKTAIDQGYRHIDCALVYGNEKEVGDALREKLQNGSVQRDELFITSKAWNTFHSKEAVEVAIKKTLEDLQLEYVDLYLIHWPHGMKEGGELFPKDADGNIEYSDVDYLETWQALESLVERGLCKSIGLSNFNSEQVQRVLDNCKIRPVINQVEAHVYFQQHKLREFCKDRGIFLTAYAPLGSPARPAHLKNENDPSPLEDPVVLKIAKRNYATAGQVLIKYLLELGFVVIPKSVNEKRLQENLNSVNNVLLTDEDKRELYELDRGHRLSWLRRDEAHKYWPFRIEF